MYVWKQLDKLCGFEEQDSVGSLWPLKTALKAFFKYSDSIASFN